LERSHPLREVGAGRGLSLDARAAAGRGHGRGQEGRENRPQSHGEPPRSFGRTTGPNARSKDTGARQEPARVGDVRARVEGRGRGRDPGRGLQLPASRRRSRVSIAPDDLHPTRPLRQPASAHTYASARTRTRAREPLRTRAGTPARAHAHVRYTKTKSAEKDPLQAIPSEP